MLITRKEVESYLKSFLDPEDQIHIDLVTDLCWIATIVLEYGFQCPKAAREERKKSFFELVQKLSDARKEAKVPVDMQEYPHESTFPNEKQLTVEDFSVVCDLFYKITEEDKKVTKEKLLNWLGEAWDAGVYQQRVYSMEVEGCILNQYGIVAFFGADLALFGSRQGLIPN